MDEPVNPYASPILPAESKVAAIPEAMIARFEVGRSEQQASARIYRGGQKGWLSITLAPLAPILFLILPVACFLGGAIIGMLVAAGCSLPVVALYAYTAFRFQRQNLLNLQAHPLIGAIGPWELVVSRRDVKLTNPHGQRTWQLADIQFQAVEGHDIVFYFEPNLPFAVPGQGKYVRMSHMLRKWLLTEVS